MNSNFRKMLLAAAGLVVLSLPASAAGSTAVTDSAVLNKAEATKQMQLAQRPYDPSAGSVGFKKSKKKKKKSK